jgi:hypothetical protein
MLKWIPYNTKLSEKQYPIAIIYNSEKSELHSRMVIYDETGKIDPNILIELNPDIGSFKPYLDKKPNMSIRIALCGGQGAGKSYMGGHLLDIFTNVNPKLMKPITIFSRVRHDQPLDKGRFCMIREKVNKDFILKKTICSPIRPDLMGMLQKNEMLPSVEQLKDRWLIFDDIENMNNRALTQYVMQLRDDSLLTGRHHNIDVIIMQHNVLSGIKNQHVLNECNWFILYPNSSGLEKVRRFLKYKIGMNNKQIDLATNLRSRAIIIKNEHPRVLISDHLIFKII